jgi:general secretion pathway protein J
MMKRERGFTLVELLVAISVLAIVAVLGWRGLDSIVRARVALTNELDQTRGLQLAFAQMQSDCLNIVDTNTIGGRPVLASQPGSGLTLVRTVFSDNQPSRLQVIAYRVNGGVLTRRESAATRDLAELDSFWSMTVSDGDTAQKIALKSDVSDMSIRSWDPSSGLWRIGIANTGLAVNSTNQSTSANPTNPTSPTSPTSPTNPPISVTKKMLNGLEVTLSTRDGTTKMVKVFLLGAT